MMIEFLFDTYDRWNTVVNVILGILVAVIILNAVFRGSDG